MSNERDKIILELLLKKKKITVKELAAVLYVSEPSVRRDLVRLEAQNLIKRIHGGAMIEENAVSKNKIPFKVRELEESSAKIVIAKEAVKLVEEGNIVFLDASTSAYNLIPFLEGKNVTVVTNGVKALEKLAEHGINAISTGGALDASCMSLVGEEAYKTIEAINADICFFSCRGLDCDGNLTDIFPAENYIRARMIKHSRRAYLLCSSEKFGKKYFHNLCNKTALDGIISD
jgi:DeoR/GlpR family transcriptional regulator of sugar metabolism